MHNNMLMLTSLVVCILRAVVHSLLRARRVVEVVPTTDGQSFSTVAVALHSHFSALDLPISFSSNSPHSPHTLVFAFGNRHKVGQRQSLPLLH